MSFEQLKMTQDLFKASPLRQFGVMIFCSAQLTNFLNLTFIIRTTP